MSSPTRRDAPAGESALTEGQTGSTPPASRAIVAVWVHRYGALLRDAWLIDLQYRASITIWMVWGLVEPALSLGIWWSIAGGGDVEGFARADFSPLLPRHHADRPAET